MKCCTVLTGPAFRLVGLVLLFLVPVLAVSAPPHASAAQPTASPAPFPLTPEGHVGGDARIVKVDGQTAYLGEGTYLTILDLRAMPRIELLASLPLEATVQDIAVAEGIAAIALTNAKVVLVAVNDLHHPAMLGSLTIGPAGVADDVEVVGTHVYVASVPYGFQIYDVRTPSTPLLLGTYPSALGSPTPGQDLAILGTTAYALSNAGTNKGVQVIDVSDPAAPTLVRVIPPLRADMPTNALTVSEGRLYVLGGNGLRIFDLATPTDPLLMGAPLGLGGYGVAVAQQRAYVTGTGLSIVDVATPSSPQSLGYHELDLHWMTAPHAVGTTVVIPAGDDSLIVVDVTDPAAPATIDHTYRGGDSWDLDVAGNLAYVATMNGLQIVDISTPGRPRIRSIFGRHVQSVKVIGDRAYLAILPPWDTVNPFFGLQIVDIRDPEQPTVLGSLATEGAPWRLEVIGTRVALLSTAGLEIFDASDPTAIRPIGTNGYIQDGNDLDIGGPWVHVALQGGVTSTHVNTLDERGYSFDWTCHGTGIDAVGPLVYLALDECGLVILDLSNPEEEAHWRELGRLAIPAQDVRVVGAFAIVCPTRTDGLLSAVDISNPAQPTLRSRAAIPSDCVDVEVQGDRVVVASFNNGMQIFRVPLQYVYIPMARQASQERS